MPDQIGDGKLIKVTRPITCFTEWSLDQSLPHTTRYGRLAFGFPKRFVLERGGQPVVYVRDSSTKSPYVKGLLELAAFLNDPALTRGLPATELGALRDHFNYLSHFAKSIRRPPAPRSPRPVTTSKLKSKGTVRIKDDFRRKFGGTLHYLEEREWRIVFDPSIKSHFQKSAGKPGQPEFYLPFKPGAELFTVVLPDNRTVSIALSKRNLKRSLRDLFFPEDGPHVTIVSLQDIGTF